MRFLPASAALSLIALASCGGGPTDPRPRSDYDLQVRYLGDAPSAAVQAAFTTARTRIRAIVTGGLTPVGLPLDFTNVSQCDSNLDSYPDVPRETINGLVIYVAVVPIDGAGLVLGNAGPCLVRQDQQSKPALGVMRLDEADLGSLTADRLNALILHEMLHVVGLGTIWTDNGLLIGEGTNDARFTGPLARVACVNIQFGDNTCQTNVPVHSADGEGSAYAHWRESTFTNELMTPFLGAGASPLSAMSMQSLADMGYQVSTATAEPYEVQDGLRAEEEAPSLRLGAPLRPRFGISATGRLVPLSSGR